MHECQLWGDQMSHNTRMVGQAIPSLYTVGMLLNFIKNQKNHLSVSTDCTDRVLTRRGVLPLERPR